MKRSSTLIPLLVLSFCITIPMNGQGFLERIAKRAQEKVEKKAEEKANEKVDETIDKSFDKAEKTLEGNNASDADLSQEERERKRMSNILGKMGVSSEPVKMADNYHFTSRIKMKFETQKKSGKIENEGEIVTFTKPGEPNFAYEFLSGELDNNNAPMTGVFLMDFTNNVTLILSEEDGKKTGVALGMGKFTDPETWQDDEEAEIVDGEYTHPNLKKTGRTKNIVGYKCEEYEYADEDSRSEIWITKEMKWNTRDIYSSIFRSSMVGAGLYNGVMLESTHTNLRNGEKTFVKVTEIDKNSNKTFTPADYEIVNVGSFSMNAGGE